MKAADITDAQVYEAVRASMRRRQLSSGGLYDLYETFGAFPPKILLAKLRQMINKGRLDGCACGCYGGFEIPEKGNQ
jgi:hypothetical protein